MKYVKLFKFLFIVNNSYLVYSKHVEVYNYFMKYIRKTRFIT